MTFAEVLNFLVRSGFGNGWLKWEVKEFCRRLGISTSLYYSWQKGGRPRNENIRNIAQLLKLNTFFEHILFDAADGQSVVELGEMVHRRDLLKLSMLAGGGLSTSFAAERVGSTDALVSALERGLRESKSLEEWESISTNYGRAYFQTAPEALTVELATALHQLRHQITSLTNETTRARLLKADALMSGLMAMSLSNLQQPQAAIRWWAIARRAADASGDTFARVWVRSREAVNSLYIDRPHNDILLLAEEAYTIGGSSYGGESLGAKSQVLALMGHKDEARCVVESIRLDKMTTWTIEGRDTIYDWPERFLWHTQSYVYSYTGCTIRARRAQERVLKLYTNLHQRPRALVQLHEALCTVHDGHVDDAAQAATAVIQRLPKNLRSTFVQQVGHHVLSSIPAALRQRHSVAELSDVLDVSRS